MNNQTHKYVEMCFISEKYYWHCVDSPKIET